MQSAQYYALADFDGLLPARHSPSPSAAPLTLTDATAAVTQHLLAHGYRWRGTWLNGPCPFPDRHRHGDAHPSFGFNSATGYGYCFVCGTLLLRDLCPALGLAPPRRSTA